MDVSIVVINKNKESVIDECLKAIVKQKGKSDELIVIDDLSTDQSLERIQAWEQDIDSILSIESYENRSRVRNYAAEFCTKDIIIFVDSDVIIGPKNIDIIRKIHQEEDIVGTNGNVFGNNHDIQQFEFLSGFKLEHFIDAVSKNFYILYEHSIFFDHRFQNPKLTKDEMNNWENYYTTCASVRKDTFIAVGGFDENIIGWGGEDSEFGYRINKLGRIKFEDSIVSFHVPHNKNLYSNYGSFLRNMYYFLGKHQKIDYEIYSSFLTHDKKTVKSELCKMNKFIIEQSENNEETYQLKEQEICINLCDAKHSTGGINYFINGKTKTVELMGFAIPFDDNYFKNAFLSSKCHILPIPLMCKLLQEVLRVSENVFLKKNIFKYKRYDGKDIFDNDYRMMLGVYYISESITDFEIVDVNDKYYKIAWKNGANMYLSKKITGLCKLNRTNV